MLKVHPPILKRLLEHIWLMPVLYLSNTNLLDVLTSLVDAIQCLVGQLHDQLTVRVLNFPPDPNEALRVEVQNVNPLCMERLLVEIVYFFSLSLLLLVINYVSIEN